MKKSLISILLICIMVVPAISQPVKSTYSMYNQEMNVFIIGGYNMASFDYKSDLFFDIGLDYKSTYDLGILVDFFLIDGLYLSSGIIYRLRGANLKIDFFGMDESGELSTHYIDIPLTLKYYSLINNEWTLSYYVRGGGFLGIGLSGEIEANLAGQNESMDIKYEDIDNPNIGLTVGIGFRYQKWELELGYLHGLTNTYVDLDDNEELVTRDTYVTIAYQL